jgi:glycosyltransferase involved in cell wall biosynthesis
MPFILGDRMQAGRKLKIAIIIPAYNEACSIVKVISEIPEEYMQRVLVVDNNSTDATFEKVEGMGLPVLREKRQGYGFACLAGIEYLKRESQRPDIVVFIDADYSDYPEDIASLISAITEQDLDLVLGSRTLGERTKGAMKPWQTLGNRLVVLLINIFYKMKFTDVGPLRAIKFDRLINLDMQEKTYGWTVEMQVKAIIQGLRILEVPVRYRARIGKSKISGTLRGSLLAGFKMASVILRLRKCKGLT